MEMGQLQTFLAILERGGFSRAATALGLTQPTVSFHVKSLEDALGVRLLDREGGRIRATPAGVALAKYAKQIVSLRAEAMVKIRASEDLEAGHLHIAASTIPGEYLLPPALAAFRQKHPAVEIKVHVSDSQEALALLIGDEYEIAFVGTKRSDRRIVYAPFARDEVVLVGPSPNPFAREGRISPAALKNVPLVGRETGSGTRVTVGGLMQRSGISGSLEMGSTEAVKRAVRHGMGLGFVSRTAVEDEVRSGVLEIVQAPGLPVKRAFFSARVKGATLSAAARAFLDHVHKEGARR
jgi:DNA-binding transcriptional LysR family regulator